MKNFITKSLLLLMTVALTAACSSDSETIDNETSGVPSDGEVLTPIRITANYAGDDVRSNATRVSYSEDGSDITATWEAGDQIKVVYNGNVSTLDLESGAGTASATFTGTISGTPSATSMLICYVSDQNNTSAVTVNTDGSYTYTDGTFLAQDGTLAGAAKCNLYYGATFYGTGEDISCDFAVNTSMMKFTVYAPDGVTAGDVATLTYKSDGIALAAASFTVGTGGKNTIYMTVPAGQYTGEQTLQYVSGTADESKTLSTTKATFTAGQTYSKDINYASTEVFVATSSNWSEIVAAFNASESMAPRLVFDCDTHVNDEITITRADGEVDFGGHNINVVYVQNNVAGKSVTLKNGILTYPIDGALGTTTYFAGTVILENITSMYSANNSAAIYTDGHAYVINSGTYAKIESTTSTDYPGTVTINGGYFNSLTGGTYTLYGGKYVARPSDSWCASGYSIKSNTDDDAATYPYIVSAD